MEAWHTIRHAHLTADTNTHAAGFQASGGSPELLPQGRTLSTQDPAREESSCPACRPHRTHTRTLPQRHCPLLTLLLMPTGKKTGLTHSTLVFLLRSHRCLCKLPHCQLQTLTQGMARCPQPFWGQGSVGWGCRGCRGLTRTPDRPPEL